MQLKLNLFMSSNPSEFAKDLVEKSYYDKYEAIEKVIKENKLDFARAFIAIDTGDHSRNRSLALRVSIDERMHTSCFRNYWY